MIQRFRIYWNTRTLREKRLLLALGGVLAVALAWLLIVRPLDRALDNARARHDRAVIAVGQVEARLAAIEAVGANIPARPAGSVRDVVSAEALRVGFNITDTEALGNTGARVRIDAARPQIFFAWVADMENRLGLDVEALTARPNSDETLNVDVTFQGGR